MSRVSSIFDHDPGEESSFGHAFVWLLPWFCFGGSVLLEKILAFFWIGSSGAVIAVLVFTASMVVCLITMLNSDAGGAAKVVFAVYSLLGWSFGSFALFVLNAIFNHQSVT